MRRKRYIERYGNVANEFPGTQKQMLERIKHELAFELEKLLPRPNSLRRKADIHIDTGDKNLAEAGRYYTLVKEFEEGRWRSRREYHTNVGLLDISQTSSSEGRIGVLLGYRQSLLTSGRQRYPLRTPDTSQLRVPIERVPDNSSAQPLSLVGESHLVTVLVWVKVGMTVGKGTLADLQIV
ncbi:hypothetical protein VKT23_019116 [Stygiomarasmius scandens]|uniref:Uncharacterized protein n=1 Tax=Marasmiellus scandens TaxID=2682957 RepID=A0ABR1IPS1_9AGAR